MSLQKLRDLLPEYAKDIKLNLGTLAQEPVLSEKQRAGTFIASALGARNAEVAAAVLAEFAGKLEAKELAAAKAAAAVMAMNNVYYRFLHLVENDEYGKLPAKLRMSAIGSHGVQAKSRPPMPSALASMSTPRRNAALIRRQATARARVPQGDAPDSFS